MSELERNTMVYFWKHGLFLKFSQSDQWFNNIAISTFVHSTAVDLPSSYSDRYLIARRFRSWSKSQICWERKSGVLGEKPSKSYLDRQISAHVRSPGIQWSLAVEVGGATDDYYANLTPQVVKVSLAFVSFVCWIKVRVLRRL